ncbi:hypothetical protein J6590_083284 [Homalodisca vitripennis]|nr:hypothetical protein J6590_083284 [Homalodisca vitripennis]
MCYNVVVARGSRVTISRAAILVCLPASSRLTARNIHSHSILFCSRWVVVAVGRRPALRVSEATSAFSAAVVKRSTAESLYNESGQMPFPLMWRSIPVPQGKSWRWGSVATISLL